MSTDGPRKRTGDLAALMVPESCALLVQEMQRGVVGPESGLPLLADAATEVDLVDHVVAVVRAAREVGVPVVHCTAENLPGGFGINRNARLFLAAHKAGMQNLP